MLDGRSAGDNDIIRLQRGILRLPFLNIRNVVLRGRSFALASSQDQHGRVGSVFEAPGQSNEREKSCLALDWIDTWFFDSPLDCHVLAVIFADRYCDLRVLQILGTEFRRKVSLQLLGGFSAAGTSPTSGRLIVPVSATCTVLVSSGTLNTVILRTSAGPILYSPSALDVTTAAVWATPGVGPFPRAVSCLGAELPLANGSPNWPIGLLVEEPTGEKPLQPVNENAASSTTI